MNRRKFNLIGASSVLALSSGNLKRAQAASADQVAMLNTTLTPFGAERAGSADGSIPAWTGGMSTDLPAGVTAGQGIMPDFFASDAKIVTINASNMTQYQDKLSEGVMQMMRKYPEFKIDVYPTRRTAMAPQWFYDNTAKNAVSATLNPGGGGRFGFSNAYGGIPFPILDSDPDIAGAQIMYNHNTRWSGTYFDRNVASHVVDQGQLTLTSGYNSSFYYAFDDPNGSYLKWNGFLYVGLLTFFAPPASQGQKLVYWGSMNVLTKPTQAWEYLAGQGRVRKAPQVQYDNPQAQNNGELNEDDDFLFNGALDRYDWKLLGKKEIYIPYNCNKLYNCTIDQAFQPQTLNTDAVRWELHRVWVVDATLHPGERHTVPHRRFYVDEDSWSACLTENSDAEGNFWHTGMAFPENRPDMPGLMLNNFVLYNLQSGKYTTSDSSWNTAPYNAPLDWSPKPPQTFNPQTMAAQEQY